MRKKYLSALLFGALLVTSAGTFTSCKDYDDDIKNLQEQVDAIEKSLSELSADFGELAYVSSVEFVDGKLKVTSTKGTVEYNIPDENTTYTLSGSEVDGKITITLKPSNGEAQNFEFELPAQTEKFDPSKLTLNGNKIMYNGQETGVTLPAQKELSIVEIKDAAGCIVGYAVSFGDETTNLMIVDAKLKGLVFNPSIYYQGIEAMKAPTYAYNAKIVQMPKENAADEDFSKDAPVSDETITYMTPGLVAEYHLNPSNVTEKSLPLESLSFIAKDVEYSRAGVVKPEIYDRTVKDGILTVKAKLTEGAIKDIEKDGEVTVLALKATTSGEKGDTIITSDYAAVKKIEYSDLRLEFLDGALVSTKAVDAINLSKKNSKVVTVEWNDEDGVDLADLIRTTYQDGKGSHNFDENANAGEVEKYGFEYRFELVGYFDGNNKTSQSAHAAQNPEDESVVRPQMTEAGKQQDWGYTQSRATIGRQPLVRVILFDTNSQKNAAVGYIKLNIVDTKAENVITEVEEFGFGKVYTVSCSTEAINHNLVWHQVEEKIIDKLGISKQQFEEEFRLDAGADNIAYQFNAATGDAVRVEKPFGTIKQTMADTDGTMTEVLQWTVAENEAYEHFVAGNKDAKVIVRYIKDFGNGTFHYVYVTFNWAPSQINVKPSGTINDAAKIAEMWFNQYSNEKGTKEVHLNVSVPGTPDKNCTFDKEIFDVFDKTKDLITGIAPVYEDFQNINWYNSNNTTFKFVLPEVINVKGVSGKEYKLVVDKGSELLAYDKAGVFEVIAVLENGNTLKYNENEFAKDILNYADHKELAKGQTFSARLEVVADNCNDTRPVELSNNQFDVRFLRPISVNDKANKGLTDGLDNGDKIAFNEVIAFSDWRDITFDKAPSNYYEYYGVKAINVKVENITTNLNGATLGEDKIKDINPNIDIIFNNPASVSKDDFGTLIYKNNGNVLSSDYQISVPVEITYKWGTIKKDVVITVHKTTAQ